MQLTDTLKTKCPMAVNEWIEPFKLKSADPPRRVGVDVATKLVTPINLAVATLEIIIL